MIAQGSELNDTKIGNQFHTEVYHRYWFIDTDYKQAIVIASIAYQFTKERHTRKRIVITY